MVTEPHTERCRREKTFSSRVSEAERWNTQNANVYATSGRDMRQAEESCPPPRPGLSKIWQCLLLFLICSNIQSTRDSSASRQTLGDVQLRSVIATVYSIEATCEISIRRSPASLQLQAFFFANEKSILIDSCPVAVAGSNGPPRRHRKQKNDRRATPTGH